jgi:hypothetical protein
MYKQYISADGILQTNAIKKINANNSVTCIPFDPANTDYANFKKDLANGAELLDAEGNVIDGIAYLKELV